MLARRLRPLPKHDPRGPSARGSSGRVYKRPSFKNLLCWLVFWQASSTEQLDQSNLIIFHAYTV
jgi:hypothetical protein